MRTEVEVGLIEDRLAELWRRENEDVERAVTRAALWNVIAHSSTVAAHEHASAVLARASTAVPQRSILIHATADGEAALASSISANCHTAAGRRQVCSEEIAIVASGRRMFQVPPLVRALLLPDMPVAMWWNGDLPDEHQAYVEALLEPTDRLIVDSRDFDGAADLELVARIAARTTTAPADLNWARIEEWRTATAALFDPPRMRERLHAIRVVRVSAGGHTSFAAMSQALLYAGWLIAQSGAGAAFEFEYDEGERGIAAVDLTLADGCAVELRRREGSNVVFAACESAGAELEGVAPSRAWRDDQLIVRLLERPQMDAVYLKSLHAATALARGKG